MLDECAAAGLPEPDFAESQGALWLTFRKDILTEEHLRSLGLNERQIRAVLYVKEHGQITNIDYQRLAQTSRETAKRDLADLVARSLLTRRGTGRNVYYVVGQMGQKWAINGSREPES